MELRVFNGDATSFDKGGIVVSPIQCKVIEEANGIYNLTATFARDDKFLRHTLLKPMNLIYASVPSKNMPLKRVITTTGTVDRWQVHGQPETVWSLTITAERFEQEVIYYMHSTVPEPTEAEARAYCLKKYSISTIEFSGVPLYKTIACKDIATTIPHQSPVNCLTEYEDCIFCVCKTGAAGYVKKSSATHVGTFEGDVWSIVDAGIATGSSQPFRIVNVVSRNGRYVDVTAQHVYFDSQATEIMFGEIVNKPLTEVCEQMNENGQITFHAGSDVYINGNYAASNTVQLVVTLCDEYDLQLVRDGWDAYLLPAGNTERVYTLETGKNIVAYTIAEDVTNLKTRYVPYVSEEPHPDDAVDSERINDYIKVYTGLIQGETVEDAQEKARKRFADGVDLPEVAIDVQPAKDAVKNASVFDSIRVKDTALDLDYTSKINRVEYDPIMEDVTGISSGITQGRLSRIFSGSTGTWQNTTRGA